MFSTSTFGKITLSVASFVFLYWTLLCCSPFLKIDEGNPIECCWRTKHRRDLTLASTSVCVCLVLANWFYLFFPSLNFAFVVPAVFGFFFVGGLMTVTLYHFRDDILSPKQSTNEIDEWFYLRTNHPTRETDKGKVSITRRELITFIVIKSILITNFFSCERKFYAGSRHGATAVACHWN